MNNAPQSFPTTDSSIRVAILDDSPTSQLHLRTLIDDTPGLCHVCSAATGEAALALFPKHMPQVLVMETSLNGSLAPSLCIEGLLRQLPGLAIILYTASTDQRSSIKCLRAGAIGHVAKRESSAQLLRAIQLAAHGGAPLSAQLARTIVESFHRKEPVAQSSLHHLSSRELEILTFIAQGARNKTLATQLKVSAETVRNHLRSIFNKLQFHSRTEAAAHYWAHHARGQQQKPSR
jgi:DNA-binding NarL/FixJ family response regulator